MTDLIKFSEDKSNRGEFVEPYFIEKLGCEGLSASDIAKSLGVNPGDVRRKLLKRDFLDRIKTQGFRAMTIVMVNDINDLEYEEILLDTRAAKFFVGKYDNEKGDSYLAFLLRLEQKVDELDAEIKGDLLLQEIANTMNLRRIQLIQERRLRTQEVKTVVISDIILDSQLTQPQKKRLKDLIDAKANACGSIKFAGAIQRDLKDHFDMNATNDKWYHLQQRDYEKACRFVEDWGRY